ncbi:MAG: hypothetical protein K6E96_01970 [Bacteroidales bacterium]|nr:hypothetical protein [Bacteroidales bacterium]
MIPYLPKKISTTAIYIYLGSLAAVTILFIRYAMSWEFILIGIMWVLGFFLLSSYCGRIWKDIPQKNLLLNLFFTALGLRWAWAIFAYVFYLTKTGMPFEFSGGDSIWYYEESIGNVHAPISAVWNYLFVQTDSISDSGYVFYLSLLSKITGYSILLPRLVNSIFSATTCLLVYFLTKRSLNEETARMAAIFCCFMPNFIYYCGMHLKESFMIFLLVAFLERSDNLLRSKKYSVISILVPVLLAVSLFSFRTVLGAAAVFSFATALVFTNTSVVGRGKRIMLIAWGVLAVVTLTGGVINTELQATWDDRESNQDAKRSIQTARGNQWAKYATGTVMAPMMFVMPFPTMVDVDEQYNQQMISGGNYVRNFFGGFVLLAVFSAIFITKNWRNLSLIGSFVIAYLGIVSSSGFANSERFLLPALPGLLIMAAYGISLLNSKNYRFVRLWYYVVPLMVLGWAYFKLGSRGLF